MLLAVIPEYNFIWAYIYSELFIKLIFIFSETYAKYVHDVHLVFLLTALSLESDMFSNSLESLAEVEWNSATKLLSEVTLSIH